MGRGHIITRVYTCYYFNRVADPVITMIEMVREILIFNNVNN